MSLTPTRGMQTRYKQGSRLGAEPNEYDADRNTVNIAGDPRLILHLTPRYNWGYCRYRRNRPELAQLRSQARCESRQEWR